jgi:hypothetical protein
MFAGLLSLPSTTKWVSQERKQNVYVANGAQYDNYTITNSTGLQYANTADCHTPIRRRGNIFLFGKVSRAALLAGLDESR